MAMIRTDKLVCARLTGIKGKLTDDKQGVPLPLPCLACAGNGSVDLRVGIGDVLHNIFGAVVDLLDLWLLDVHQFRDFLVQPTEFDHILFDLANGARSFQSSAFRIVGLSGSRTGNLHH